MKKTETVELGTLCLIYHDNNILLQDRVKADCKGFTLPHFMWYQAISNCK